jgi:hypothetical protein
MVNFSNIQKLMAEIVSFCKVQSEFVIDPIK